LGLDHCTAEREWSSAEIDAIGIASGAIGAALANAQLHHETQIRALQFATLRDVSRNIGGVLDQDAVLRMTLEQVCQLVGAPRGAAYLADTSARIAVRRVVTDSSQSDALGPPTLPLKNSLTGQVIITGRPIFIERASQDTTDPSREPQALPLPDNVQSELPKCAENGCRNRTEAKAAAIIPLAVSTHVLGTLVLAFDQSRTFFDGERRLLVAVGEQAGVALANAHLFQETVMAERQARHRADQLSALQKISRIVNASLNLNQSLFLLLEQLVKLVPYDSAAVFLTEGNKLRMAAERGFRGQISRIEIDLNHHESLSLKHVVDTGKPVMLKDAQQDEWLQSWVGAQNARGWVAAPLLLGTELVGILTINHHLAGAYDKESTRLAQALADQTAVAIYKARLMDGLQRANRELRRLDELKDQFIQNVAHELRTPLTMVRGYVELLAQEDLDRTTQDTAIKTALSQTQILVQLVEAITTLQDLSIEGLTLDRIDLSELISTVRQLASQKALRAEIDLRVDCPTQPPTITGDFIWLSQALYQLLDNAIKFSPPGGQITLATHFDSASQELHITVEDQGIGVPADEQEQIFELFYQADGTTTRRFGGTGMGLAIVKRVVQAHGGRVWVESPPQENDDAVGGGSRFIIILPQHSVQPQRYASI
jgi:signal transduction histidine kinase